MGTARYSVRMELFEGYVLSMPLPPQFTLSTLLKVPEGTQSATEISYGEWTSLAGSILGLSEAVATTLFELYCTYTLDSAAKIDHTRDELAWGEEQRGAWLKQRTVSLPPFLLFVFCQQHHPPSAVSYSHDAWQQTVSPNDGLLTGNTSRDATLNAMSHEHEHVSVFVTQHLYHLLALLAPNKYKVNYSQINALGILLSEGDKMTSYGAVPFGSSLPFWWADQNTLVDIALVQQHISEGMAPDSSYIPYDVTPVASPTLVWKEGCTGIVKGYHKTMLYKGAAPHRPCPVNVHIYCCHNANIYLLAPFHSVTIFGCVNTNIVLGPVSGILTIESCDRVRVVCPSRGLRLTDTTDSRVYTCVNTPPLILAGCRSVELAPYNTFYPALENHFKESGVNPTLNLWNSPVQLTKQDAAHNVSILPPELFTSITIPFTNHSGSTHSNPCAMPAEYQTELKKKVAVASNCCSMLRNMAQSKTGAKAAIAKQLNDKFKGWLQASGNIRHVLELLHYDEDP
eukprot:TRINITY_DN18635_c0_g1_i1.p1 TRINITY_DN18635_c0_g1~~TRINITY_DN18635_c0_g1_i1.p1  ORF type:complete len:512 (+),score=52.84 TRINITY_DN18635_c0_g1_i1:21-1556(+)